MGFFFRNAEHNKHLLVTSEVAVTALGISLLNLESPGHLPQRNWFCFAQTNWCCFHPSCHMLSRVWRSTSAILNLTETCSSMMSAICHRNSKPFILRSFATLTGKLCRVISSGTASILWSLSLHHCCGTSGYTLPFNTHSLLCRLFTLLNSLATPVWSDLWGIQFRTVPPAQGLGSYYVLLCFAMPSDHTVALGSAQLLTEMSTRSVSWG